MKVRETVQIDSAARTKAERGTESDGTLDAMTDSAKNSTKGKRQDSAYGNSIPALLFFVSEIGSGDRNRNPIVLHPKIGAIGPRPKEKILQFFGIPARGLGALCNPGRADSPEFKNQTQLMTHLYIREGVKLHSADAEEGEQQVTQDLAFFQKLLEVGPITAFCTIEHGDNYGLIDSFEALQGDQQRRRRTERSETEDYRATFNVVGSVPMRGLVINNPRSVRLLGMDRLTDIGVPSATPPAPVPPPQPTVPPLPASTKGRVAVAPGAKIPLKPGKDKYPDADAHAVAKVALKEFEDWPMINPSLRNGHYTEDKEVTWNTIIKYTDFVKPYFTGNSNDWKRKWIKCNVVNKNDPGDGSCGQPKDYGKKKNYRAIPWGEPWMWSAAFIRWVAAKAGFPLNPIYKHQGATHNGYTNKCVRDTHDFIYKNKPMPTWIFLPGKDLCKLKSSKGFHPHDYGAREIPYYEDLNYDPQYGDVIIGRGGSKGFHNDILTPKGIIGGNVSDAVHNRSAKRVYGILTLTKRAKELLKNNPKPAQPEGCRTRR